MNSWAKTTIAIGAALSVLAVASTASAAFTLGSVVNSYGAPADPVSPSEPGAVFFKATSSAKNYAFNFTISGLAAGQKKLISFGADEAVGAGNGLTQFDVCKGAATASSSLCSGVNLLGTAFGTVGPNDGPTVSLMLGDGTYSVEILKNWYLSGSHTVSGNISMAVPEPASWAVMLLGMGILGGALRRRARVA
jgi:PEP-CTERM motif